MSKQVLDGVCQLVAQPFHRRDFIKASSAAGLCSTVMAATGGAADAKKGAANQGGKQKSVESETLVKQLYDSLKPKQRQKVCFAFDHPLRQKVDNNWRIVSTTIGKGYDKAQQDLIKQIFLGLHSEEYAGKVLAQVEHDNQSRGGFAGCSVALFGVPGSEKFEFVLTGRHVTRRADGNTVHGTAFGGPIFYGHAARGFNEPADHAGNLYWYQAQQANKLFAALDGKQRQRALLDKGREEKAAETVKLSGQADGLGGLPVSELSADQKQLTEKVMSDVLAPFRKADRDECLALIKKNGLEKLHLSYYAKEDVGRDGVWDVWQIEGPAMVWYFRGDPHVHTWVHVRESAG